MGLLSKLDVQGKSLIHLLCHIGTEALSWALLGAQVTGIDISPESLKYSRKLSQRSWTVAMHPLAYGRKVTA